MAVKINIERYATRREASSRRLQAVHAFTEGDRVATSASIGGSFHAWMQGINIRDYYTDIDTQIEVQTRGMLWHYEHLNDDYTGYGLYLDAGPIGEGVVFNCEVIYPDNTSPRIVPFITTPADVERLQVCDPRENPRVAAHLARQQAFADRINELGLPNPIGRPSGIGIHPPLSCATAIADANWVYQMMYDDPVLIRMLFEKCFQQFCLCQEYAYELTGGQPGSLGLADDNSAFVSDPMYREQVLPWNLALYERYGQRYRSLHADGPNQHHYETYAHLIHLNHMDIGGWSTLRPALEILKSANCIVHGNLNNRDLYAGWTDRLRQKIRQTIRLAAPGGGYEFAIGGETYAHTDPQVLCQTFEYAAEVGAYPITIPDEPLPGEDDNLMV